MRCVLRVLRVPCVPCVPCVLCAVPYLAAMLIGCWLMLAIRCCDQFTYVFLPPPLSRYGHVLYDSHVRPKEKVTDYRTFVSGVVAKDIKNAPELEKVQQDVSDLLLGKTLVGHTLFFDFKVLMLNHPQRMIRDSARYKPFRKFGPGLKKLCAQLLGLEIQEGAHSSVIDAQATMLLYIKFQKEWEENIISSKKKREKKEVE